MAHYKHCLWSCFKNLFHVSEKMLVYKDVVIKECYKQRSREHRIDACIALGGETWRGDDPTHTIGVRLSRKVLIRDDADNDFVWHAALVQNRFKCFGEDIRTLSGSDNHSDRSFGRRRRVNFQRFLYSSP